MPARTRQSNARHDLFEPQSAGGDAQAVAHGKLRASRLAASLETADHAVTRRQNRQLAHDVDPARGSLGRGSARCEADADLGTELAEDVARTRRHAHARGGRDARRASVASQTSDDDPW